MKRRNLLFLILGFTIALSLAVLPQKIARVVDSTGTVINFGKASATTAAYNETIQLVTGSGNVVDSFTTSFYMGTAPAIAATVTNYVGFGEAGGSTAIAAEANGQYMIPAVCTISNLRVKVTTAVNANHPVITVDKNTTGQTLTCTVDNVAPDTTTYCQDLAHTFTTAAGDLLSVKLVNPASANSTGVVYVAFQINC